MAKSPCFDAIKKAHGGSLSDSEIKDIIERVRGRPPTPGQALANAEAIIDQNAGALADDVKLKRAFDKRAALITMQKMDSSVAFAKDSHFRTLGEAVDAFYNNSPKDVTGSRGSVDVWIDGTRRTRLAHSVAAIDASGPNNRRIFISGEKDLKIAEALSELQQVKFNRPVGPTTVFGEPSPSIDPEAMQIAKAIFPFLEENRVSPNMHGAMIADREDFMMSQYWNQERIQGAGSGRFFKYNKHEKDSRDVWMNWAAGALDQDKIMDGRTGEYGQFLASVHASLYSGTHGKVGLGSMGHGSGGSLSKAISQRRVLHFKNPKKFLEGVQLYGHGNLWNTFVASMDQGSKNIALLQKMGPNPELFDKYFRRKLAELVADPASPERFRTKAQADSLNSRAATQSLNSILGKHDHPSNPTFAKFMKNTRSVLSLGLLERISISQIADGSFWAAGADIQGFNGFEEMAKWVFFPKLKGPERKRASLLIGTAIETVIAENYARVAGPDLPTGMAGRLNNIMFKLGGSTKWNDHWKSGAGMMMANAFGESSGLRYGDLDLFLRNNMNRFGINELEWDLMKGQTVKMKGRNGNDLKMLFSDNFREIPKSKLDAALVSRGVEPSRNNRYRLRNEIEGKYNAYIIGMVNDMVLTPGNREKLLQTGGLPTGSVVGEVWRSIWHLKTFPTMVYTKVIKRDMLSNGSNTTREFLRGSAAAKKRMFTTIATSTALGYVSLSLLDVTSGRTRRKLTNEDGSWNWKVLAASMMRGGGLGIAGDLMFSEFDKIYRRATDILLGPTLGQLDPLFAMKTEASKAIRGEENTLKNDAVRWARNIAPFYDFYGVRPAMDYLIYYHLLEWANPGSTMKLEKNIKKHNNQEFIFSPNPGKAKRQFKNEKLKRLKKVIE